MTPTPIDRPLGSIDWSLVEAFLLKHNLSIYTFPELEDTKDRFYLIQQPKEDPIASAPTLWEALEKAGGLATSSQGG